MDSLKRLNGLSSEEAFAELSRCCASSRWVQAMVQARPYLNENELYAKAASVWQSLDNEDWLEAFRHHPKIGDLKSLQARFASTGSWAKGEQSGASGASDETIRALADGNAAYEDKFGFIFIVCATGKKADEMLALLEARLGNEPKVELSIASAEQAKITRLRIEKLLKT